MSEPFADDAEFIRVPRREYEKLKADYASLRQQNALLEQKVDLLIRRLFGVKSEQLDPAQLELLLDPHAGKAEASADAVPEADSLTELLGAKAVGRRPRPKRERWPADLPVQREVIDPPEVQAAPERYRLIGEEISEQLDYEPARFYRRQLIRRKFVSREDPERAPQIAPLPPSLQERCVAAPGLLAQLIVSKYGTHLPLYRQEQLFWERHRVWLPRASQARWLSLCSQWLEPVYRAIKAEVMAGGYVQVDETPIKYLDPGRGQTAQGYFWVAHRPGGDVLFDWQPSRATGCLERLIPVDFRGTLQCDGYASYDAFARRRTQAGRSLTLAGCWAHVRRAFFDAKEHAPAQAGWVLRQIQHLYRIEKTLRQQRAGPRLRDARRASESRPILERIHRALLRWQRHRAILPQSTLGKAIHYALQQWPRLGVYLRQPTVEIDNNLVENAIRPTAIGKKNWLFVGDVEAGHRSAVFYTLLGSCRRRGIEPYAYLRDVLTRLPHLTNWQVKDITPAAWAKAHRLPTQRAA